jgi:hypothetical protein
MYLKALQEVSNTANEISQQDDNYSKPQTIY